MVLYVCKKPLFVFQVLFGDHNKFSQFLNSITFRLFYFVSMTLEPHSVEEKDQQL